MDLDLVLVNWFVEHYNREQDI